MSFAVAVTVRSGDHGFFAAIEIWAADANAGPASHQAKAGTPTMGGVLIVAAALVTTLLFCGEQKP